MLKHEKQFALGFIIVWGIVALFTVAFWVAVFWLVLKLIAAL